VAGSPNVVWHDTAVSRSQRWQRHGCEGLTVWFTGLSGSGKSTVADAVAERLLAAGRPAYLIDGDNVRHGLNADLGFSAADRTENIRRVGEVARLMADAGLVALVPVISPYAADRDRVRAAHEAAGLRFVEIFVDTPLDVCERRDPKGLYRMARAGQLTGFTGVDDPYEPPNEPELRLTPASLDNQVASVLALIGVQARPTYDPGMANPEPELLTAAIAAKDQAYAPYSQFPVGAALRTTSGATFVGCNVENAAFPQGTCAEAGAIAAMNAAGERAIAVIVTVCDGDMLGTPCGGCRQKIREFAVPDTRIHVAGPEGVRRTYTIDELLPDSFGPENLP
jgi:homotetrameric cytidine deaminase